MSLSRPMPTLRPAALSCLVAMAAVSACEDAPGDPLALLLTSETRSTLLLAELPTLPDLAARTPEGGAAFEEAVAGWTASWGMEAEAARTAREAAYRRVAEPLAAALGAGGVGEANLRLGRAIEAASLLEGLPEGESAILRRIAAAREAHQSAAAALDLGEAAGPLELVLRGTDALLEVGPERVARVLIRRAEGGLDRAREVGAADRADVERAERLLRGARAALDDADFGLAVRRAYYACQLLGVPPR